MSTSDDSGSGANRRRHPRTPLNVLVQFRFDTFDDFLAEYSLNISPGGIFIRTEEPQAVGAVVYLQFSLKDGSRLIEGMGKVVRVSPKTPDGPPAGMGIEFVSFDEDSRALIEDICAQRHGSRS